MKLKNSENAILPFVNSFETSRAFEPVTNQVISNDIDRNGQVNNVEMKSIIHERNPTVSEYRNNLTASGCMLNLKEDNDTFVLKTNKVTTKSDADIEIVYEKLVAYESEGNGRISWKKNGDQRVIENKEKTKSVCKDFLRAKCNHGKRCNRLHICKYFLTGSCNKSSCLFDHVSICSVFMSGRCFGCDKYHVFIPKSFSRLFSKPQAIPSHVHDASSKNLTKNGDGFRREAPPFLGQRRKHSRPHPPLGQVPVDTHSYPPAFSAQQLINPSRLHTPPPYPLLSPPPLRIQKSYFLPPYSMLPHTLPTPPQTSNFLTDMNHYSHPAPLSQHLTKPQPIRFIPRAYPVNVTQV